MLCVPGGSAEQLEFNKYKPHHAKLEGKRCQASKVRSSLPCLRPVLTGTPTWLHGACGLSYSRPSKMQDPRRGWAGPPASGLAQLNAVKPASEGTTVANYNGMT